MPLRSHSIRINGAPFHYARTGSGPVLLLLHGWPEFWLTWKPVMERLADRFTLIAPDLRGFGQSGHPDPAPSDQVGADSHTTDMEALIDALDLGPIGIVSHDVGAYVAQTLARRRPAQIEKLFFFDCPYPGLGGRWATPDHLKEIWYQSFNQLPWAAKLIGASRETCRTYFYEIIRNWLVVKNAFDPVIEEWVDNFMARGNIQGGFNWYRSANASRLAIMRGEAPKLPPIETPTRIYWGAGDPVIKAEWGDRLGEYFTNLEFSAMAGVGHFPHMEAPDRAAAEIARFFGA